MRQTSTWPRLQQTAPQAYTSSLSPDPSHDVPAALDSEGPSNTSIDSDRTHDVMEPEDSLPLRWEAVEAPAEYSSINHRPTMLKTSILSASVTFFLLALAGLATLASTWTRPRATKSTMSNITLLSDRDQFYWVRSARPFYC